MFNNFKNDIKNTKQNFICGICLSFLKSPLKCPSCSFLACRNCFSNIFKVEANTNNYFSLTANCPACKILISFNALINLNNLNEIAEVSLKNIFMYNYIYLECGAYIKSNYYM